MKKTFNITTIQFQETVDSDMVTAGEVEFTVTTSIPSDDFKYICQVKTSAGLDKVGFISNYDKTTGVLTVEKNGSTTVFVENDEIYISGVFMKNL